MKVASHVAESREEVTYIRSGSGKFAHDYREKMGWERMLIQPYGVSPIKYLQQWGVFDESFLAVHCVQASHRRHPHPEGSGRRRRPLPQEQRQDRLRHRSAARPAAAGRARRLRHRQPGGQQHHGHVRRDAHRPVPAPRRRARRARAERAQCVRIATLGGAEALGLGRPGGLARARQAGRPHRRRRVGLALHADRRPLLGPRVRRQPGRRPVHCRGRRGALSRRPTSPGSTADTIRAESRRVRAKLQARVRRGQGAGRRRRIRLVAYIDADRTRES